MTAVYFSDAAMTAAALLAPDSLLLPADLEPVLRDRDGDQWLEVEPGRVTALSGPIAWSFPGHVADRSFVETFFGPLVEVTP